MKHGYSGRFYAFRRTHVLSTLHLQHVQPTMNHRQVISVSFVAAIPAAALLTFVIINAINNGGSMNGVLGAILAISGLLALLVAILPFLMFAWPNFFSPPQTAPVTEPEAEAAAEADELEADGFDDEVDEAVMDDEFDDDGFDDDSFSDDEFEDFEDEDDEWK